MSIKHTFSPRTFQFSLPESHHVPTTFQAAVAEAVAVVFSLVDMGLSIGTI